MLVAGTGSMDLPRLRTLAKLPRGRPIGVGARRGSWSARQAVRDARVEREASNRLQQMVADQRHTQARFLLDS